MFLRPKKKINFVKEVLEEVKKEMRRIEVSEGLKKNVLQIIETCKKTLGVSFTANF